MTTPPRPTSPAGVPVPGDEPSAAMASDEADETVTPTTERPIGPIARLAYEAYGDGLRDTPPTDEDDLGLPEEYYPSLDQSIRGGNGDTLRDFLMIELTEGLEDYEDEVPSVEGIEEGIRLVTRAADDLERVMDGLRRALLAAEVREASVATFRTAWRALAATHPGLALRALETASDDRARTVRAPDLAPLLTATSAAIRARAALLVARIGGEPEAEAEREPRPTRRPRHRR